MRIHRLLIPAVMLFAALGVPAAAGERILHVYTWDSYFDQEAIRRFEERNGCSVEFNYYDSNETMHQTLRAGGGYDVITPPPNTAAALYAEGLLRRLDHARLPNLEHLERGTPVLGQDPMLMYSVPYTVTVTGVGYNRELVAADATGSWAIFADARYRGKMTLLNDMREALGAGLKYLGYGINSVDPEEVRAAGDVVEAWKVNIAAFEVDAAQKGLRDGKFLAIQAYNGDIALIIDEHPEIGFFVPAEGSALNADCFVIGSDSEDADLAHAFINHFLDPEIAAMNMESTYYYMPNTGAIEKISPRLRNNPAFDIPADIVAKCELILNLGAKHSLYDAAWEEVLFGTGD